MKAGLSIQELGTELRRRDEAKLDYLVHTGSLHMDAWGTHPMLRVSDAGGTDLVEPLDILPTAHRQLGDYHAASGGRSGLYPVRPCQRHHPVQPGRAQL